MIRSPDSEITAVIPAHLGSRRLPRKLVLPLGGISVLEHTWRRVVDAAVAQRVVIATDSPELEVLARGFGAEVLLTPESCRCGSERVAFVAQTLEGSLLLNVQGDQPLLDEAHLEALAARWRGTPGDVLTPIYPLRSLDELHDPNVVKVVRGSDGEALYFSRGAIPHAPPERQRALLEAGELWGHVGIYGFGRESLEVYRAAAPSPLEGIEGLEQLRLLEAGWSIGTVEVQPPAPSLNGPADYEALRARFEADAPASAGRAA